MNPDYTVNVAPQGNSAPRRATAPVERIYPVSTARSALARLAACGLALASLFLATRPARAAFGYTDNGTAYVVDTGAGLVFKVDKSSGDMTSIVYNGVEYASTAGKYSGLSSGLGSATVTPQTDGSSYVLLTLQTGTTGTADPNMTHYLAVRNGESIVYMATFPGQEPNVGELRWITRLNHDLLTNGPAPSDLRGNNGNVESADIFGMPDGTTRSKYYGDSTTHGKDREMDLTYYGATGTNVGVWMVFGNRESSSGGPFFRDIENQGGTDQEIYNYMNSGHNQTEAYRLNVLHGPYALVFTNGAPPRLPLDFTWMDALNLQGWVPASGRGSVTGTATGIPSGFQGVVGFANATAQYWAVIDPSSGSYTCPGMKPGDYTATLYKGELGVATGSVTVAAGSSSPLNLACTEPAPTTIFRIGDWDGTPAGFLNAANIPVMHPSDARQKPWGPITYLVGATPTSSFPAIQFRGANSPTTIKFNLAPNQLVDLTLRIGITCAYNSGRPQVSLNGNYTSPIPAASDQPKSRSFTIGTYRGNNTTFTYTIPASALVAGINTLTITPVSGSSDLSSWLSAGWVYDAVELDGPAAIVSSGPANHFVDISTRCYVGTGDSVATAGFVLTQDSIVIVRAAGPSLAPPPFNIANVLAKPSLTLFNSQSVAIVSNQGWKNPPAYLNGTTVASNGDYGTNYDLAQAMSAVNAFSFTSSDDSAIAIKLPAGLYTAQVKGADGGSGNAIVEVYLYKPAGDAAVGDRFSAISTRCHVGTGDSVGVVGLVLEKSAKVLLRAVGPSLAPAPFNIQGTLSKPSLTLFDSTGTIVATNVGWQSDPVTSKQIAQATTAVGDFPLTTPDDSALLVILPAGIYTAQVKGADGGSGNAIVEAYLVSDGY